MLSRSSRVRSMIADCKTERDIINVLRSHKVKYSFSTEKGFLTIRIPCRTGTVHIYRTCSRSAPYMVRSAANGYPYPVPSFSWDD